MREPIVLVDARNVQRSRWPNVGDAELVHAVGRWASSEGVRAAVIFDERPAREALQAAEEGWLAVLGTGARVADDVIVEYAAALAGERESVWVVTSDRQLRERVAGAVSRTIGGGSFLGTLGLR